MSLALKGPFPQKKVPLNLFQLQTHLPQNNEKGHEVNW